MKIFEKTKTGNIRTIRLFGVKVCSYRAKLRRGYLKEKGSGNRVINQPGNLKISIYGSGNSVEFEEPGAYFRGELQIGVPECPVSGCRFRVGAGSRAMGVFMIMTESGSEIDIGRNVLFSWDVSVFDTDTHALVDADGALLNGGPKKMTVADKCWIGHRALLMKNVRLPEGTIVGAGAVVSAKAVSDEPYCAYAGNPAQEIRRDVHWDPARPDAYAKL